MKTSEEDSAESKCFLPIKCFSLFNLDDNRNENENESEVKTEGK
jgi:hypothetical protein